MFRNKSLPNESQSSDFIRENSLESCSEMPFAYTSKGESFVSQAVGGNPQALAYFNNRYEKTPKASATWFKNAEKTYENFQLALRLATARLAEGAAIELSPTETHAVYSGPTADLELVCSRFPYQVRKHWFNTLSAAPEMINFPEPLLTLTNYFNEKRMAELEEQCQVLTQNNNLDSGAESLLFFKNSRASLPSSSSHQPPSPENS